MFYCDACRKPRKWPQSLRRDRGLCEICGKVAMCNDVPSADLPTVNHSPKQPKRPVYTPEEAMLAAELNTRIERGDVLAYAELTKLAAATVKDGRWVRDA
jgi:hypothetical protein